MKRPVLGPLGLAVDGLAKALTQDCWAMPEPTLGQAFTLVEDVRRDLDRVAAAVLAEVDTRGGRRHLRPRAGPVRPPAGFGVPTGRVADALPDSEPVLSGW